MGEVNFYNTTDYIDTGCIEVVVLGVFYTGKQWKYRERYQLQDNGTIANNINNNNDNNLINNPWNRKRMKKLCDDLMITPSSVFLGSGQPSKCEE